MDSEDGVEPPQLTVHQLKTLQLKDLRVACRAYGVSPAGGREALQDRLQEVLERLQLEAEQELAALMQASSDAEAQAAAAAKALARSTISEPQAAGITYPEVREVPVRPQVEAVRHEIYGACDEDKEAQFVVGEERPFLRSSGVGHLFGKAPLDDGAFRPTKRIAPVDMVGEGMRAAGDAKVPSADRACDVPPRTPQPKVGAYNSVSLDHLFKAEFKHQPAAPQPGHNRYGLDSHGMTEVLSEATVERSEAVQAGNGAPKGPPSHTTEVPHLDEETQDMIRDLTVQDLRAMLRKRGCNPAGGREMLQERLTHYLLGEKMDVGFEEVKSGIEWNTSALDNHAHEPKQRHGVRILSATGGGPSSLNYLFNQEDTK